MNCFLRALLSKTWSFDTTCNAQTLVDVNGIFGSTITAKSHFLAFWRIQSTLRIASLAFLVAKIVITRQLTIFAAQWRFQTDISVHCPLLMTNVAQLFHLFEIAVVHCAIFTKIALDQFGIQTVNRRINVTQRAINGFDFSITHKSTCATTNSLSRWTIMCNIQFASLAALSVNVDVSNHFVVCTAHPFVLKDLTKYKIVTNFVITKEVVTHFWLQCANPWQNIFFSKMCVFTIPMELVEFNGIT